MKPRHLIFIVLIGMGLIAAAPTSEKAGQADNAEATGEPPQDVKVVPSQEVKVAPDTSTAKLEPASFTADAGKLKKP